MITYFSEGITESFVKLDLSEEWTEEIDWK